MGAVARKAHALRGGAGAKVKRACGQSKSTAKTKPASLGATVKETRPRVATREQFLNLGASMNRQKWIVNFVFAVPMVALVASAYIFESAFRGPRLLLVVAGLFLLTMLRRSFFRRKRLATGQRMAVLVQEKKYQEAIAVGEGGDLPRYDVPGWVNLVAAYYFNGNLPEARKVLDSLGSSLQYTGAVRRTVEEWQVKLGV